MSEQPLIPILAAIQAHLAAHDLPEARNASVSPAKATLHVPHGGDAAALADGLLRWVATLTGGITAQVWRVPDRDSVQLSVLGQLGDIQVELFGGVPIVPGGPGADLDPDQVATMTLGALREVAGWVT